MLDSESLEKDRVEIQVWKPKILTKRPKVSYSEHFSWTSLRKTFLVDEIWLRITIWRCCALISFSWLSLLFGIEVKSRYFSVASVNGPYTMFLYPALCLLLVTRNTIFYSVCLKVNWFSTGLIQRSEFFCFRDIRKCDLCFDYRRSFSLQCTLLLIWLGFSFIPARSFDFCLQIG